MKPEPNGPEIVVGQLQFEFEGVAPLTVEQRISTWLEHQEEETPEMYSALLLLADNESRQRRARRWNEIRGIQSPYEGGSGWLISGGIEVSWLYDEACRDYINGAYFSALLCAHAACERELAGSLSPYREELPKGWMYWGLGKLIPHAAGRHLISPAMRVDLEKLTEVRKVSAHFKEAHKTPTAVPWRANLLLSNDPQIEYDDAVDSILKFDALFAIQIATKVARGNLGFSRPWY